MYLLYAPPEKFRLIPPKTPLISEEVKFTNNVAYCSKFFWKKHHVLQGCRDITPAWMVRMRRKRQLHRILILATGGFGDVMWSMPVAKALRAKHPRAKILVATDERRMPIFYQVPYVDLCVKDEFWNLQNLVRESDEVYDFGGIATMLKKEMRLDPIEATFMNSELPLPAHKKDCRPHLVVTIDEGKQMQAKLKRKGIDVTQDKIISTALNSSTPNRDWPLMYSRLLTESLLRQGYKVVWLSDRKELADSYFYECECGYEFTLNTKTMPKKLTWDCPACSNVNVIPGLSAPEGVVNLCGQTNIREAMAVISFSDAFIGPNSGLMVIATSLEIPTVGLFGAFNPSIRCKFYDKFTPLWGKVQCAPCNEHWTECPCGHPAPCMKVISPNMVYDAILATLKKYPRQIIGKLPIE